MLLAVEWLLTAWMAQSSRQVQSNGGISVESFRRSSALGRPPSFYRSSTLMVAAARKDDDVGFGNDEDEDYRSIPDFIVIDDDDDETFSGQSKEQVQPSAVDRTEATKPSAPRDQNKSSSSSRWPSPPSRPNRPRQYSPRSSPKLNEGSSWMERNAQYSSSTTGKSFREDFRGTRVFVQGIPAGVSWQTLKDHFRTAGTVVFASVSYNGDTGIVQYETTDQAANAIQIMREYPLEGVNLYVRADLQENKPEKQLGNKKKRNDNKQSGGVFWQCASPDYTTVMEYEKIEAVENILKSRDQARRRRNFDAADSMREQLRYDFGVQLDDRSHLWWISTDDDDNEDGQRSSGVAQWEQIKTEYDDKVDSDVVFRLLNKRDAARRKKDFTTADALLEQTYKVPQEEGVSLRIHDESRTWRVWLDEVPRSNRRTPRRETGTTREKDEFSNDDEEAPYRAKCIALMEQHDPEKLSEVMKLLENFPASTVFPRLSKRYL